MSDANGGSDGAVVRPNNPGGVLGHMVHSRHSETTHADDHPLSGIAAQRISLAKWLESNGVQSAILFMVLVEMICVLFEIFLKEAVLDLRGKTFRRSTYEDVYETNSTHVWAEGDWTTGKYTTGSLIECVEPVLCHSCCKNVNYNVGHYLHMISLLIMVIFGIEIALLIFALGMSFFKHFWYVVDFILVYLTLACEIVFAGSDAVSVLVFLRCWRLVRIVHAFVASIEAHHAQYEHAAHVKEILLKKLMTKHKNVTNLGTMLIKATSDTSPEYLKVAHHMKTESAHSEEVEIALLSATQENLRDKMESKQEKRDVKKGTVSTYAGNAAQIENPVASAV